MQFGLKEEVIEAIQQVLEQNSRVDKAIVFGSRTKGNYKEGSDIDLALKGDITAKDRLDLHGKLEALNLPYSFDLVNYNTIKEPALKEHIDRVGVEMYSRWKRYRFSDFVEINPVISLESSKEYSFIEMKDLQDGKKFCFPSTKRTPASGARFQNGDTLFAKITPCLENGKICQARGLENDIGFGSTEFFVFRGKTKVSDNDFVFYLSRWDEVRVFAESNFEGTSGRQRVPKNCFDKLIIEVPDLKIQKGIAKMLSALDDKIDLLHRQNKTLEQMAETLFRQWFVEEAKGSWKEKSLRKIADHYKENINPSKFPNESFHHFSIPAFDEGKYPKTELGSEILSNKYKVIPYSILISKLNPRFPRVWELFGNDIPNNSVCSTEFQIVRPKELKYFGFIYYYLKSKEVAQELANAAGGTSGSHQRVKPEDIFNLSLLMPSIDLIEEFGSITKRQLEKIKSNTQQIQTLIKLRDNLLPKLFSGEVRIDLTGSLAS